jgi:hypothetical protein
MAVFFSATDDIWHVARGMGYVEWGRGLPVEEKKGERGKEKGQRIRDKGKNEILVTWVLVVGDDLTTAKSGICLTWLTSLMISAIDPVLE